MVFIRADESDREEVLALYNSLVGTPYCVWHNGYPGEKEFDFDISRDALYVLKDNGIIVGTISADLDEMVEALPCWNNDLQPSVELSRLGVRIDYQNRGIARRLLCNMMEEMKNQGKRSVHFLVCKYNIKALRSYDKLGFDNVGECHMYDDDYFCYEKALF